MNELESDIKQAVATILLGVEINACEVRQSAVLLKQ